MTKVYAAESDITETCKQRRKRSIFELFWCKRQEVEVTTIDAVHVNGNGIISPKEKEAKSSPRRRIVRFNPRVGVLEYNTRFTNIYKLNNTHENPSSEQNENDQDEDEEALMPDADAKQSTKLNVIALVQQQLGPCDRGPLQINTCIKSFTSPLLKVTPEDIIILQNSKRYRLLLEEAIGEVLIVESHSVIRNLHARSMEKMLPRVRIHTARDGQDALDLIRERSAGMGFKGEEGGFPFDVVIMNHRLLQSRDMGRDIGGDDGKECKTGENQRLMGSDVFYSIRQRNIKILNQPLLIGTSMRLKDDCHDLARSGADCIWGLPPPAVSNALRNNILIALLNKRSGGQSNIVIL